MNESVKVTKQPVPEAQIFPVEAFISPDYVKVEGEKLWPKVWQQACRVEELQHVGDYVVYDILHDTVLITRSDENRISAFYNVCQHRGRRLADGCGRAMQFRCKYHAWAYNLTGENIRVLDEADWNGALSKDRVDIPKIQVDTWGGWVWINQDPDCVPLRQYLEPIATMLDPFEPEKMRYRWRLRCVFDCNWKTALEAFAEAYHVEGTHPQMLKYAEFYTWSTADGLHSHKGFDERKDHLRTLESKTYFRPGKGEDQRKAIAEMQEHILTTANASTTQTMVDAAKRLVDELPETATAAEVTAHWLKSAKADDAARGVIWPEIDRDHLSAAGNSCVVFPNLALAYGFTFMLCYRARPYGDDPNKCVFEGYVIERYPEGQEPKTEWIDAQPEDVPPLWPPVLMQDFANMGEVQKGMRSRGFRGCIPNPKQEETVTNLHRNLADIMGTGAPTPLKDAE